MLLRAIQCLSSLDQQFAATISAMDQLLKRRGAGRFHLAVLGQFKRGKSTLLNALLGEAVLPAAVVPVTAIPTFIRSGDALRARVMYNDGRPAATLTAGQADDLARLLSCFVTETGNPKNHLSVSYVEVFHPAPILSQGLVLIDTPGIGSTFRHNTEGTLNFLSQCDAALFLVSTDPPITEVELEFLKQVRNKVPRLFFIMNKVDYLDAPDREAAVQFLRTILAEHAGLDHDARIFCVSALAALRAKQENNETALTQSGLMEVQRHLLEFLRREKSAALSVAIGLKGADLLDDATMRLRLAVRSLQMPTEELEGRLAQFDRRLADIGRERTVAADLLAGERKRLHALLESLAEQLRQKAQAHLQGVVQEVIAGSDPRRIREPMLQDALAEVIPDFFDHELGRMTGSFSQQVAEALRPHQDRANELIESVRRTAAELFDVPYHAPESAGAFEVTRDPYWVSRNWTDSLSPIPPNTLDRILPAQTRLSRIKRRIIEQIDLLVVRNVENLRWSIYLSLDQALSRFGAGLDERLTDTINATHGAIAAASAKRRQAAQAATQDINTLERCVAQLTEIATAMRSATRSGADSGATGSNGQGLT
jgi:GTPase SAR1 family protein/uncharacterized protein YukE